MDVVNIFSIDFLLTQDFSPIYNEEERLTHTEWQCTSTVEYSNSPDKVQKWFGKPFVLVPVLLQRKL